MNINIENLIRASGLAAIVGGIIFAGIQPIHPADELASVTTGLWSVIIALKFVMCLLFLIGITGIYARQADKAGWIGLVGFCLLTVSWFLQSGFVFVELFVLPVVAAPLPAFIDSYLGVVNGNPGIMAIGALVPTYAVLGVCYLLGGLLFGIATIRANVLSRWPAMMLAFAAIITPVAALLPHALQRYAAVPMGLSMIWLGYALWSEHRPNKAANAFGQATPRGATTD